MKTRFSGTAALYVLAAFATASAGSAMTSKPAAADIKYNTFGAEKKAGRREEGATERKWRTIKSVICFDTDTGVDEFSCSGREEMRGNRGSNIFHLEYQPRCGFDAATDSGGKYYADYSIGAASVHAATNTGDASCKWHKNGDQFICKNTSKGPAVATINWSCKKDR